MQHLPKEKAGDPSHRFYRGLLLALGIATISLHVYQTARVYQTGHVYQTGQPDLRQMLKSEILQDLQPHVTLMENDQHLIMAVNKLADTFVQNQAATLSALKEIGSSMKAQPGQGKSSSPGSASSGSAAATFPPSEPVTMDLNKPCPKTININTVNDMRPPAQVMSLTEVRSVLKGWLETYCPIGECLFASLGQHLLKRAIELDQTLITVQIGAMDGVSNDPMYSMLVKHKQRPFYVNGGKPFDDLSHWLPVLIEPVPSNYEALVKTYAGIAKEKGLGCAVPIHAAASYDPSKTNCPFCRVNTSPDAPEVCQNLPDWMKFQLGTLDCEHSKRFFKSNFDKCVIQDPIPCSSLSNLLADRHVPTESIAMVQIDIEGYEYVLLEGMMKELPEHLLPPIIHFEHKVLRSQDIKNPLSKSSRIDIATTSLETMGYVLYDMGEDALAVKVAPVGGSSSARTRTAS